MVIEISSAIPTTIRNTIPETIVNNIPDVLVTFLDLIIRAEATPVNNKAIGASRRSIAGINKSAEYPNSCRILPLPAPKSIPTREKPEIDRSTNMLTVIQGRKYPRIPTTEPPSANRIALFLAILLSNSPCLLFYQQELFLTSNLQRNI